MIHQRALTIPLSLATLIMAGSCGSEDSNNGAPIGSTAIGTFALSSANTVEGVAGVNTKTGQAASLADLAVAQTLGTTSGFTKYFTQAPPALTTDSGTDGLEGFAKIGEAFATLNSTGGCDEFFTSLSEGLDITSKITKLQSELTVMQEESSLTEYGCTSAASDSAWAFNYTCNPSSDANSSFALLKGLKLQGGANDNEVAVVYGATMDFGALPGGASTDSQMLITLETGLQGIFATETLRIGTRVKMDGTFDGKAFSVDMTNRVTLLGGSTPSVSVESVVNGTNPQTQQAMTMNITWAVTKLSENQVSVAATGSVPNDAGAAQAVSIGGTITRTDGQCTYAAN